MTLRKRTLLTIGAIGLTLIVVLYALASTILLHSYTMLEQEEAHRGVERVQELLKDDLNSLNLATHDWASWDDMYTFAQDGNEEYREKNLVPQTYLDLQLDLLLVVNSAGEVIFGAGFDRELQEVVPLPAGTAGLLVANRSLVQPANPENNWGIVLLPQGPLLVSSWPILPSSDQGEPRGVLVMGRFLSADEIERLAHLAGLSFEVYRFDDPALPSDMVMAQGSFTQEAPIVVQPLDAERVAGYAPLRDVAGVPVLLLRVILPRTSYRQGQVSFLYMLVALVVATVVFGLTLLLFVERTVLRRLSRLSHEVGEIRAEEDLSKRVSITGQDELSQLAESINGMIAALGHSQQALRQSEGRYRHEALRAAVLVRTAARLSVHLDPTAVLDAVCEEAARALGAEAVMVYLYDDEPGTLCPARGLGLSPEQFARLEPLPRSLYNQIVQQTASTAAFPGIPTPAGRPDAANLRVLAFASMHHEDRLIGILCVLASRAGSEFGEDEQTLLQGFADQAVLALVNARLFAERRRVEEALRRRTAQMEALRQVGLELAAQLDLEALLRSIVMRAIHLLEADDGGLYLYRPERAGIERVVSVGDTIPVGSLLHQGEGLSGRVWETGQPLIVDDYQEWAGKASIFQDEPTMAVVGVPVRWGDKFLGILNVAAKPPHTFSPADAELLGLFASQAAVALENARLYGDLQRRMEQLKDTQAQLIRSARLVAVGELAAGVAHQLNNSLTPILGYAELLAETLGPDSPGHDDLARITVKARQASEIVRNLLDFARQVRPQKQLTNLNETLRKTLALVRTQLEKANLTIEEAYAPDLDLLPVDTGQIGQVFLNLINNAAQAMTGGGTLRLRTYRAGNKVAVAISDTGPGMPDEVQEHLFEPFFTTQPGRAGLGLAVSLGIVQEHGGQIEVESAPGQGSTFTVLLPLDEGI